ncbi:MAG: SDR family oxidoreductase [Chloroflexi bacterium]|nr:SDR family oxidoreductase [Chloroflexota bacterium]
MVTGATAGIGLETAKQLAQMGASVIVVGRNERKCITTVAKIRQQTGNAQVESMVADLSSQKEIRGLAEQFKKNYTRLDVLVNNAGVVSMMRQESVDKIEMTFAVNHLGYFLLTHLLLDSLKASAPSRIVNVSSGIHPRGKIDFNDLQAKRFYNPLTAYSQSKLANVMFTYALVRRLEGTRVTVNALHPGEVRTNLVGSNGWLFKWIAQPLWDLQAISVQEGAKTSVYLASSPEVEGVTGKYFSRCKPRSSSPESYDEQAQERLWKVSEELVGI